jgi:hypothetical protein
MKKTIRLEIVADEETRKLLKDIALFDKRSSSREMRELIAIRHSEIFGDWKGYKDDK